MPSDSACVLPELTDLENVEKIIMWHEQRMHVNQQLACLLIAKRLVGCFKEDSGIRQYDYDQLKA